MKTKPIFLGVFLCFLISSLWGQEEKRKFISLETGMDFISCESPEKDYIRRDIDPYSYGYVTDHLRSLLHTNYFGAKFEYRMLDNLLGIAAGVRYTRMVSSIGKTSYWSDTPDFFFVLFGQDGITTEFAKVREIIQKSDYLGIPLEIRIYPYKERVFNVYYKVGAAFNFNVRTKEDVVFFNDDMESYQDDVSKIIEEPYPFYSSFHLGIGFKVGKFAKPGFNIEVCVPAGMLTTAKSGFVTPQAGGGFQFMIRLPL